MTCPLSNTVILSLASLVAARTTVMNEDTEGGKVLIRKEVLRLIVSLSSSVGVKSSEQGLLM